MHPAWNIRPPQARASATYLERFIRHSFIPRIRADVVGQLYFESRDKSIAEQERGGESQNSDFHTAGEDSEEDPPAAQHDEFVRAIPMSLFHVKILLLMKPH